MKVALMEDYLTTRQVAQLTGKNQFVIARMCKQGRLPARMFNGRYLIPSRAVTAFIRKIEAERELQAMQEASHEAGSR